MILAAKVDEHCLGEGYHQIESEIIKYFENDLDEQEIKKDTNPLDDTFKNPSFSFSCTKCDFVAKSASGLKTHSKRKHKNFTD